MAARQRGWVRGNCCHVLQFVKCTEITDIRSDVWQLHERVRTAFHTKGGLTMKAFSNSASGS